MKDIYILGIETSCDETAASVVKNGRQILSMKLIHRSNHAICSGNRIVLPQT